MNRPPFRRGKTSKHSSGSTNRGPVGGAAPRYRRALRAVVLVLVALSLFQFVTRGEVTWPGTVYHKITAGLGDYATRPEAAWRKASKKVEELGARKQGQPLPDFDLTGRVTGVLDGDSIVMQDQSGKKYTIRLFGIDTPERGQPHADTARSLMREMLLDQAIGVVKIEIDRYNRTVGTVYLDDANINLAMVAGGHAWWYRRYAPHDRLLEAAQQEAREADRGLWALPDPVPPWEWRRAHR